MFIFDFIKINFSKIVAVLSILATTLSVFNYMIGFRDRKKKMKQNNRDLFYRPLSVRLGFSDQMKKVPCINENEYKGDYLIKPLEMMCFQGYFKSIRLFRTNFKGRFAMTNLSLTLEELKDLFEKNEPYKELVDLGVSPIFPNYISKNTMVMCFYILVEGFLGEMQTFMIWYAFDEKTKQMIACDVLDNFVLLDKKYLNFSIDDVLGKQSDEINTVIRLGIESYDDLLYRIRELNKF